MSLSYINYRGKNILLIDYTDCKTTQDTLNVLELVKKEYLKTEGKVIALNDFTGVIANNEYMDLAKKYAKELFDEKTLRNACVGVTGVRKILLSAYNLVVKNKLMPFDTKEEALQFLVK